MATKRMLMILLALTAMFIETSIATDYTIGGPNGWSIGSDLQTWTSSQTFLVGDNLVFAYPTAFHDVVEVTKAEFDSCQAIKPLATYSDGNSMVPLISPGKRYFICGMPGHCNQGMKLEINTLPAITPNPLAPAATPPLSILPSTLPLSSIFPSIPGLVTPLAPVSAPMPHDSSSLPLLPVQDSPQSSPAISSLPLVPGSPSSGFTKTSGNFPSGTTPPLIVSSANIKDGLAANLVLGFGLVATMMIHVF